MMVIGCVRQIIPLDEMAMNVLSSYFTTKGWYGILDGYYPTKKCDALDIRGAKYNLPSFVRAGAKGNGSKCISALEVLSANLQLHRNLLAMEGASKSATQYGYMPRYAKVPQAL